MIQDSHPVLSSVRKLIQTSAVALLLSGFSAPIAAQAGSPLLPPVEQTFRLSGAGFFPGDTFDATPAASGTALFTPGPEVGVTRVATLSEQTLLQASAIAPSLGTGPGLASLTLPDWSSNSFGLLGIGLVSLIGFFSLRRSNRTA